MRKPYFSNGMTCSQVAAAIGGDNNKVRNIVYRYRLPKDAPDPVDMVRKAVDFLSECKTLRVRPNRQRLMARLNMPVKTERPKTKPDSAGFLRLLRSVQKHHLYKSSLGVDAREEIDEEISSLVDKVIFGE